MCHAEFISASIYIKLFHIKELFFKQSGDPETSSG